MGLDTDSKKTQVWLWSLSLVAAVVLAIRSPLAAAIATVAIGFIWDRLDLTLGQNNLKSSFLPVVGAIAGGLGLAGLCLLVYHSVTGKYAVWVAIKGEFDAQMQSDAMMAIVWAAVGVALLVLMYIFTAFLVTAILAFSQRAAAELWSHPSLPYGGLCLMVAWGLPCMIRDTAAGAVALLLSVAFGGFYILVKKNSILTYFVVLFCLVACFRPY